MDRVLRGGVQISAFCTVVHEEGAHDNKLSRTLIPSFGGLRLGP